MTPRTRWTFGILVWLVTIAGPSSGAAQDRLTYELVQAEVEPKTGTISIAFGRGIPARYVAAAGTTLTSDAERAAWSIELRDLQNPSVVTTVGVVSIIVPATVAASRFVELTPATPVSATTHEVRVFLREANFPQVVAGQPKKVKTNAFYGPAKGREDADLYFKGLIVGTSDSKPAYSIDGKAGVFKGGRSNWGSFGATTTYVVDKASDIGPDTITANAKYSKVFVWAPATGLIIDADVVGFEFTSANDTRNVRSSALGTFVFRSVKLGPKSYVTGDLIAGFEAGHNSTNAVTAASLGGFERTILGGSGYLLLQGVPVVPRIDVTASWRVRLLTQDEPFTHRVNGTTITELSDDARHLFTVNAALMLTKALGFSVGYRHGSEPPAYKHVRHRVEIGFVLKLKQIDKG